jgi:purine-cytosine permease-like protein
MLRLSAHGLIKSEDTVLAAIAGYVDTLSFVALFGLFTAQVTGNFVLIGAGFAGYGQAQPGSVAVRESGRDDTCR